MILPLLLIIKIGIKNNLNFSKKNVGAAAKKQQLKINRKGPLWGERPKQEPKKAAQQYRVKNSGETSSKVDSNRMVLDDLIVINVPLKEGSIVPSKTNNKEAQKENRVASPDKNSFVVSIFNSLISKAREGQTSLDVLTT